LVSPPGTSDDLLVLYLAHEAEDRVEHYYSLAGDHDSQMTAISVFNCLNFEQKRQEACQKGMSDEEQEVVSGGGGNGEQEAMQVEGPVIPLELLFMIIGMALHADIRDVQSLSSVSQLFTASCNSHCILVKLAAICACS